MKLWDFWDEAIKINGADADLHRRYLWDAIAAPDFPEFELGLQIFDEEVAARFEFDVLDATKLIPEELVALQMVGKMVPDHNPDNFFAETEQVAFCSSHLVPALALKLAGDPNAETFLMDGRRHCKAVGFSGIPSLSKRAGVEAAPGIVEITSHAGARAFVSAARTGQFWDREAEK